jgi:3-phytase/alkaline phosphatase D
VELPSEQIGEDAMDGTDRMLLSAGDVDQDSALLWAKTSAAGPIRFEVSTEPDFSQPLAAEVVAVTDPLVPAKLPLADGTLTAGTRYYWRATGADGTAGAATFVTAAPEGARAGFHLGVSGDWRGELSPYPAIANADEGRLDLFVKLGDTAYADFPSPAVPEAQATTLEQFRLKHFEGYSEHAGLDAWNDLQKSTAILSVIDDHEVTNDVAGGAPVPAGQEALYGAAAPALVNDSPLFENGLRAFHDYNAIEERRHAETGGARTAGEWDLYRYGVHGADAAVFLLDERSFRDAALRPWDFTPADAARFLGESVAAPRTLLGDTQLTRLQADLLDAEARGVTWKFVLTPEPIENLGPGDAEDRYEGYAFERNALLQFIDERDIENVVFVAADLHATTANNLTYQLLGANGLGPQIALPAFEVTTGPVAFDRPFGPLVVEGAAAFGLLSLEQLALYRSLPVPAKEAFFQEVINGQLDLFGYDRLGLADNLD